MKKVKIAVLGMNQGYKFARDALKIPEAELVAVAGNNQLAEKRAQELNVPLYQNYIDLIKECELDGVIITLPNDLHKEAVELCADRGLHVLVEKPIAPTIEEGEAIIQACKRNKVKLLVGHHRRFSSKVAKLKDVISSGAIGELVGITMFYALAKDRPYFAETWRLDAGGGPLLINGIHDIDTLRYVTGSEMKSVYAVVRNSIRKHPVEDSAAILLETVSGVTVNFFLSDGTPSPFAYDLNAGENPKFAPAEGNCYYFFGTNGTLVFPGFEIYSYDPEHYGWEHQLITEKLAVPDNDPMTAELKHFISILKGETEPLVSGEDALETLRVINAIKQSAQTDAKIEIFK